MQINEKIEKDFNLSGEDLEIINLLKKDAEDLCIPMALEPDILKQRLPSKKKTPIWKVLSPIMAAAAACFALVIVGQQSLVNTPPIITDIPSDVITEVPSDITSEISDENIAVATPAYKEEVYYQSNDADEVEEVASSVPTEYKEVYSKIVKLGNENSAQVKGVARASNFSQIFGENSSLISLNQKDTQSQFDTLQFGGEYVYSVSNNPYNAVFVNKVSDNNYVNVAEIDVDFGMTDNEIYDFENITILNCYVYQTRLLVLGSANYNGSDVVTAVATYDISVPEEPILLCNSYQDGALISSRVSGGFVYLVTRKSISSPSEFDAQSYIPFQMQNHTYKTLEREQINISDYAQTPCYIVASSILLKEPYEFYDTIAVLGDGSEIYIDGSSIYLMDGIYKEEKPYTSIVKVDYGKGNFDTVDSTLVLGRIFDSESISEYKDTLRMVTVFNNQCTLYTFDQRLNLLNRKEDISLGNKVNWIRFYEEKIYLSTGKNADDAMAYDLSDPVNPIRNKYTEVSDSFTKVIPFGAELAINVNVDDKGLIFSCYEWISPRLIKEKESVLVAEGDIYSGALYNADTMILDSKNNLVGFSYYKLDSNNGQNGYYYVLYSVTEEGIEKKAEYQYPGKVYDQRAFIKGETLYVASSSSLAAIDVNNGMLLREIKF